jgi:Dolichyl-phosphate-mannose-protein mannosyltransferase
MPAASSRSTDASAPQKRKIPPLILFLACLKLAIELPYATAYGYFRDELYYLACARRLAWGYVDHPPLSIALLSVTRSLGGESLLAIRVVPAMAGALVIGLTGALAKTFGGGLRAQGLAALGVLAAPAYLASSHVYSMNALDTLFWTLAALFAARVLAEPRSGRTSWVLLGVALGLGLENKLSVLWYAGGLFVGFAATPSRAWLKTRWPWIAGLIAAALLAPYALWENAHGWPTREFVHNATTEKMAGISPWAFFKGQLEDMSLFSAPLWLTGLGALLASRRLERWRALGVAFLAVFLLLVVNQKSRVEYLAPAFPPLFAAGAAFADEWLSARAWAYPACAGVVILGGAIAVPFAVPVLPVYEFERYADRLGVTPRADEKKEMGPLPQFYADMFGWRELTQNVAAVYGSLTDEERREAAIYASNYGEAGAIELFGEEAHLPTPISGHNNYWLWGPRGASGKVVILVGVDPERWESRCESVEVAAVVSHSLAMPYENRLPISVCRAMKEPLEAVWPRLKHYE